MPNKATDKLIQVLYKEYGTLAKLKRYVGDRRDIKGSNGYAWHSPTMNRWCFLPLRAYFSLDTVIRVDANNLRNV